MTFAPLPIFLCIWLAMVASGFWESYAEGRRAWGEGKLGWKLHLGTFELTGYHFYLFIVMYPLLLALPFVIYGWNTQLFGIIASAYISGLIIEDFTWYLVNPVVKFKEFFGPFSDYYPWIRIGKTKLIPVGYVLGIAIAAVVYFIFA